jgi:hypothetical protein
MFVVKLIFFFDLQNGTTFSLSVSILKTNNLLFYLLKVAGI